MNRTTLTNCRVRRQGARDAGRVMIVVEHPYCSAGSALFLATWKRITGEWPVFTLRTFNGVQS